MEKTRKTFPHLFGKKKESVKVEEGEMKMETEIKKAEEEERSGCKKKIAGPEKIIFNLDLWKSKLTAGEEPPKDLLHALQSQLEASIGKG